MVATQLSPTRAAEIGEKLRNTIGRMSLQERIELIDSLSEEQQLLLLYDWDLMARDKQREPIVPWTIWFLLTGRGFGKTLTGSQTVRKKVEQGKAHHVALVAPTAADARDVMVGLDPDSSGLLQVCPPWNRPSYEPSKRRCVWPDGTTATLYSGEEPERLRGPQHDLAWVDEPASFRYLQQSWDNLMFGLRRGDAQCIVTGTPTAHPWVVKMAKDPEVVLTRGTMYENPYLAPKQMAYLKKKYEGTRLGRQELHGEILEDVIGALWLWETIDACRLRDPIDRDDLSEVVVSVDPAITNTPESDETGIVVDGAGRCGCKGIYEQHGFTLEDLSGRYTPDEWARKAVNAYHMWQANYIIAEKNQGGDMVAATIHSVDPNVPVKLIHATFAKRVRAEPIAALYEQKKWHHLNTDLHELETQMTTFTGGDDEGLDDRVDAHVHGASELLADELGGDWRDAYGVKTCEKCSRDYVAVPSTKPCSFCGHIPPVQAPTVGVVA